MAQVGAEAEASIGLDRVQPFLLLQAVGLQLAQEADASTLLAHVENHALVSLSHLLHGLVQLRATVTQEAFEDVARQALAVDAHQHGIRLNPNDAVDFHTDAAPA